MRGKIIFTRGIHVILFLKTLLSILRFPATLTISIQENALLENKTQNIELAVCMYHHMICKRTTHWLILHQIHSVDLYNSRFFCQQCISRVSSKYSMSKPRFRICYGSRIYIEFCMKNYLFTLHSWYILLLLKMIAGKGPKKLRLVICACLCVDI